VPPGRAGAQGHRKIEAKHLIFPPPLIFLFSEGVIFSKKNAGGKTKNPQNLQLQAFNYFQPLANFWSRHHFCLTPATEF
jgi:hypothetical protein